MTGSRWPPPRGDVVSRSASRLVLAAAALLLGLGVLTAAVVAMREPFALNDYAAIWGLKARALSRSLSLESLFRVDPEGAFSHPEYPPLWPLLLAAAAGAVRRYDDLAVTPLWPALTLVGVAPRGAGRALDARRGAFRAPRGRRRLAPSVLEALPGVRRGPPRRLRPRARWPDAALRRGACGRGRAARDLPDARGVDEARGPRGGARGRGRPRLREAHPGRASRRALVDAARGAPLGARRLAPSRRRTPPTDFALASFSLAKARRRCSGARLGGRSVAGWAAAAALLLALAPATRRRRRAVLAWCGPLSPRRSSAPLRSRGSRPRVARALVVGPPRVHPGRGPSSGRSPRLSRNACWGKARPRFPQHLRRRPLRRLLPQRPESEREGRPEARFVERLERQRAVSLAELLSVGVRGRAEGARTRGSEGRAPAEARSGAPSSRGGPRRARPRVTPCAASSTTTASWYAYGPSARFTTKSPTVVSTSSERGPKRRSSKVKRPGGTRNRKARASLPGGRPSRHVPG